MRCSASVPSRHGHDRGTGARARKHARDMRSASLADRHRCHQRCAVAGETELCAAADRSGAPSSINPINRKRPPTPSLHLPSSTSGPPRMGQSSLTAPSIEDRTFPFSRSQRPWAAQLAPRRDRPSAGARPRRVRSRLLGGAQTGAPRDPLPEVVHPLSAERRYGADLALTDRLPSKQASAQSYSHQRSISSNHSGRRRRRRSSWLASRSVSGSGSGQWPMMKSGLRTLSRHSSRRAEASSSRRRAARLARSEFAPWKAHTFRPGRGVRRQRSPVRLEVAEHVTCMRYARSLR